MAGISPSYSASQQLPTPSPFSFSSTPARAGWSSSPPVHLSTLVLRFVMLVLSFVSALSLANPPKSKGQRTSSFNESSKLTYCFIVSIVVFVYSAFQLFKGVCDISYRGILISDKFSDYLSFTLDQANDITFKQFPKSHGIDKLPCLEITTLLVLEKNADGGLPSHLKFFLGYRGDSTG
ncbi:hypothetical protein SAY87_012347 [Trapa incisa]|uniref:CASP-like protein n=1 Tax=Trapa incisa TaxID=236973 RepID=A0AAN7JJN6_9MYRT|nr:hypothetical protein SAY87_012347 [Trapa incisa]